MTETVILMLITLGCLLVFTTTSIILVNILVKVKPNLFKYKTEYGELELRFDTRVDE